MTISTRTKLIAAFVLVFVAGITCGFFGTSHLILHHFHRGKLSSHLRSHLEHQLQLTPAQREKIGPIIDSAALQLEAERTHTAQRVRDVFAATHKEIEPFLTPEQKTRLREMEARHHRLLQRSGFEAPPP
ncbi:MAG: hypothetical protein ABI839_01375 [Verrucomicrobiota bacterium]